MKKCAVFIETRMDKYCTEIIHQHMRHLKNYQLFIFTTKLSWEKLYNKIDCHFVPVDKIRSILDYNLLLTSPDFWKFFIDSGFERVLIFQHDSYLLKDNMDDYLPYDYVGAPWSWQEYGGNGGLSLRNPATMHSICVKNNYNPEECHEDVYFSKYMYRYHLETLAPRDVCKQFSAETIFEMGTTGYHAIERYLTPEEVEKIKSQEVFPSEKKIYRLTFL
jgi:hypothetical protein